MSHNWRIASMNMPQPVPVFPVWLGIATSLPIILVILWFVVTQKQAFTSAAEGPTRQL